MKKTSLYLIALLSWMFTACSPDNNGPDFEVVIPDFSFPETVVFEQNLSAYEIFEGNPADLMPQADFHLLELSSILFTDYAHKQRLVKLPAGTKMTRVDDGLVDFPDGTLLTKTFFYYHDERDTSLGKRIIETRLLIKGNGTWNVATYLWNEAQTDATLAMNGVDTEITWTNSAGESYTTTYHVPSQNECMTCHQSSARMTPIGPTLRNLNRTVERNGVSVNQLNHLQAIGALNDFPASEVSQMVDYKDLSVPLADRGRAYLAMNCAHCHQPDGWDIPAEEGLDFRYDTPLNQTGIAGESEEIIELVQAQEMPFLGTTILDEEGVNLIVEYVESL